MAFCRIKKGDLGRGEGEIYDVSPQEKIQTIECWKFNTLRGKKTETNAPTTF